jgi:hypothetical protein
VADEAGKKPAQQQPAEQKAPKRALARASESTDPAVQKLSAERGLAQQNQAARRRNKDAADQQAAEDQKVIDERTAQLAELGYE